MFLDRDWFSLETASTLIANHSGQLHAALPVQAPAAETTPTEQVQQQQQQGKQKGKQQKQSKQQQKQREQSPPPMPAVPLSAVETAAAALSGMLLLAFDSPLSLSLSHSRSGGVTSSILFRQFTGIVDPLTLCGRVGDDGNPLPGKH